ncbi:MAG: NADH-quinone oxidoreductase subunit C [Candidatus Omnitrophota bacterium]
MDSSGIISDIKRVYPDEAYMKVTPEAFRDTCLGLHKALQSPVMMLYALDNRKEHGSFTVECVFLDAARGLWVVVGSDSPGGKPRFDSIARDVHSASLFEREIWEMFGIEPKGNPDLRRLRLHDEIWAHGNYPMRKDFDPDKMEKVRPADYRFDRVDGPGVFEVPVGPVHAGIIGPGHFRFSSAGEPIINLEIRLGFTHRGVEKLFEGKDPAEALALSECVAGDSSFAHSLAFTNAAEKITGITPSAKTAYLRAIFLELERMYNHVNDIGGMATDVGFSFPAALASIIKETILQLNEELTGSRYLKGVNHIGGVSADVGEGQRALLADVLNKVMKDFGELDRILSSSDSFMDRVDTTGILRRKTAEDLGIVGPYARASGIKIDLRESFPGVYKEAGFEAASCGKGDVLARFRVRVSEFAESARLIRYFMEKVSTGSEGRVAYGGRSGEALGYAESWRGAVLYRLKTDAGGLIDRCKVVDPSFHNWQGLPYAVLGNIIPDFPLCNKSFDLSYSGNDL